MPDTTPQDWTLTATGPRAQIEAALVAHEDADDWDHEVILTGFEVAPARPEEWLLTAYLPREPTADDRAAIAALFAGTPPAFTATALPNEDWVTISQEGLEPIHAGRFVVHTPEHAPTPAELAQLPEGMAAFCIPASCAFGTGHHETTAGCLAMLSRMRGQGHLFRNIADIGTGTGLLAFAALHLWPRALATASDIDHACTGVVLENAEANAIPIGAGPGALTMVIADGMADPLLSARGPYDLLIANILAGPLIELAPDFASALVPGGSLLLAGLLATQEAEVRRACRRAGLRIAHREVRGDWSILWLRRRSFGAVHATRPSALPAWARAW